MKIRKQVYELTLEDLDKHPAWEFALDEEGEDGQDEATIRPIERDSPVDPDYGMCIVRTSFTLSDGTRYSGFLSPQVSGMPNLFPVEGDDGSSATQPSIVTNDGHLMFWYGILKPTPDAILNSYRILGGRTSKEVFPIRFCTDISITTGPVEGEIKGFMFIEKVKCGFLKRKQVVQTIQE